MSRALVWTLGGFAVLILGILAALWLGTTPRPADSPSAVAVASAPPTPASPIDPTSAPAALPPGADAGPAAAVRAPAAPLAGGGAPATAPAIVAAMAERKAEHDRIVQEHRTKILERAKASHERRERNRAELRQHVEAKRAMRAPDPNRPAPDRTRVITGPAVIDDASAASSH